MDCIDCKATRYQVEDGIAIIALNRPHRMNAWTGRMHTEYLHHLCEADEEQASGSRSPAMRICASPPLAPSSRPRTAS